MTYLLDTDWVIDHLSGDDAARDLLAALLPDGLAISIITFSEIYEGIFTGRDPARAEQAFRTFLQGVQVLDVTEEIALENAPAGRAAGAATPDLPSGAGSPDRSYCCHP